MIEQILIGIVAVVAIAATIYGLWRFSQKSVSFYKESEKGKTMLHVSANCNVKKITVLNKEKPGKLTKFIRVNVSRGEDVEFIFPSTKYPQKLIVECDKGVFEYEVE